MSAPARLVLLRHGATTDTRRCPGRGHDPRLSAEGWQQAAAAPLRLEVRPERVVTSPSRRARESATCWSPPAEVVDDLAERDFGDWGGRPWEELWAAVPPPALASPEAYAAYTPPGGESYEAVSARAWAAAERLTTEQGRTVVAVTSAGPLRLIVSRAIGLGPAGAFSLSVAHARAAVLARHEETWILERLGA